MRLAFDAKSILVISILSLVFTMREKINQRVAIIIAALRKTLIFLYWEGRNDNTCKVKKYRG